MTGVSTWRLGAVVLTGGASRRMGLDKATLVWGGRRAVDLVAEVAQAVGCDAVVTAGAVDHGFAFVPDEVPLEGPVGGVLRGAAALGEAGCDRVLVLAVDAPTLTPDDLHPLISSASPGAAYAGLYLPMVIDVAALPPSAQPDWPLGRLAEAASPKTRLSLRCGGSSPGRQHTSGARHAPEKHENPRARLIAVRASSRRDRCLRLPKSSESPVTDTTNDTTMFHFESDFVDSLRCVPMAVRLKLDRCGVKLTLRQWSRLTRNDRFDLLMTPCATAAEAEAYRATLVALIAQRSGGDIRPLPEPAPTGWEVEGPPPEAVVRFATTVGVDPPREDAWRRLSPLQRFTLVKLSRDNHDNVNFVPALREFGLAS